jgi:hypothetical protein
VKLGVGTYLPRMEPSPDRDQAQVVVTAADSARAMAGGEGGCLVEEEEFGEMARSEERAA